MALAYLTINLDAFTGDDHPPVPSYSTITLDPGVDHIDAAADVIHVRTIVVSLDRQGKAATANGVPCVDGKVPVVAGVMYAVLAPNVLRGGPHYVPALTAGQVVALSDYITPGAPLTPDQAAILTARIKALETTPPDTEATQDIIGAMVAGAGGTYDDAAGTITLPGGFDPVQFSIGYHYEAPTTLAASSFVTVTYGPATPSTNVGGGTFDTGTGIYTVPATGRYLILARVRSEDNMTARSAGIGVHGSNADGPYFVWRASGVAPRDVLTYQRVDSFTAGTQLRTFIYSEGNTYPLLAAALTIDRIG